MKKAIAILLVAIMALSIVACTQKATPIVGTWELYTSAALAELDEEQKAMLEATGIDMASMMNAQFTFNADGTGSMTMTAMGETQSEEFTYKAENGKLTLTATVDGETQAEDFDYTLDGDVLVMTKNGETQTFKRK